MHKSPPWNLRNISEQFQIFGEYIGAESFGNGHINDSYVATYDQGGARIRYLHQRINHTVFKRPDQVMENFQRVTAHICRILHEQEVPDRSRKSLTLVPTKEGMPFLEETNGNFWRSFVFIERTASCDVIEFPRQAREAAKAFGMFQKQVASMGGARLHETIPDFHNTPKRFDAFVNAVESDPLNRAAGAKTEIDQALRRREMCEILLRLHQRGEIPERITHNDTKLNNVLLDTDTQEGMCVIDLDTVMPGLALYDFGDLVRTATCHAAEDERDLSKVSMCMELFRELAAGYLEAVGDWLTAAEIDMMPFSGKLISFEIGLRFLTDHLLGDDYFKVERPGHNLDRCRTQFALVKSIEEQEEEAAALIGGIARNPVIEEGSVNK